MSFNSFGRLFRVTTWGESHGPALGATVDGCPPRVGIDESMIQHWLDRRKPGQSRHTTQRREPDRVRILSGVFEGQTTGTPVQLMIENMDQRSKDYGDIAEKFRPGHADMTYWQKYGIRDYRGGGRSSARETAARVAAGGLARAALAGLLPDLRITGYMVQIGRHRIDRARFDAAEIERNPFWCPDAGAAELWAGYLDEVRKDRNSVGAVVEVRASGLPAGLGAPVYGKLDTDLAAAMMSINAVKGVEIGEGMAAAELTGEANADEIFPGENGQPVYSSNHAGGILGGISTGQDVVLRFAVKPTSSIMRPRSTVTKAGEPAEIVTRGRHDPCVGIRAVPVAEAMMACVLLDHYLLHRGQIGAGPVPLG
ncbi:chorismate synthase [Pontibaca methylaminivorans]|uniref:Chorismate synthase n=1 Tax=Pontibaca methylaminivorans TaxID=515897 RepID=A0A1R3WG24_9RHOB|nr:chorismate synthase [Pontibaca methylaminivorans]SIT76907.1 chorismate synthase [Pontibaca methylaminivorans]